MPGTMSEEYHTEDYSLIVENIYHTPKDAPLSTFSVDVDAASYSNMRRYLMSDERPPKDAIRIEEMINYFDYSYPQPSGDAPIAIISEVGECPWSAGHKLVHIGIQGKEVPESELPASNLVFLVDVSGSMSDENKLPLVISSFKILVEHLRPIDRVAIVVYAGSSGLVLPSTAGSKKEEIIASLERLRAGGSTAGAAGIRLAYEVALQNFIPGGNNRVILATDGDFNVGVSSDAELVEIIEKKRESGVFLTVLGYGMGNYMDNKMQMLADHGNGNHAYVDNITEAEKVFVHEFGGTLFTIAKDVKIQVEFNPALVGAYRLIGYENRMLQNEDFNDDRKDAGDIGSNHSVTALYEIIPTDVDTTVTGSIDELKYQRPKKKAWIAYPEELMTVKFRYKEPAGQESKLIEKVILDSNDSFASTSENFRFSASVASFGMLLRESDFAGSATFKNVESWIADAITEDKNGYRKEFLKLVRNVPPLFEATAEK
ncbi:MAG: VWA domain-containing protein [Saprospiraceae bacterium]|nr:VWA domain-containing protein [Saprospiraceae bacterium]